MSFSAFLSRITLVGAVLATVLSAAPSRAGEPPAEPMLRIETGMHTAIIRRISLDAKQRWLATTSEDKTARVWELSSGRLLQVLRPPHGPGDEGKLYAVALSPNGDTVVAAGWTGYDWDHSNYLYVFERATGRLVRRVTGIPDVTNHLVFSPDGRFLAAALGTGRGVQVYRTRDWSLVGKDGEYGDSSQSADFDRKGRLVTSAYDGQIRLYQVGDSGLRLLAKQAAPAGKLPYMVRFSPDGSKIAFGYIDSTQVSVVSADSLALLYTPDGTGINRGNVGSVAWSLDGRTLYAGGIWWANGYYPIRVWRDGGRGGYTDLNAATDTVMDIYPLSGGGIVYGAADPFWGVYDANGQRVRSVQRSIADLRDMKEKFRVSYDGSAVSFGYEVFGRSPARFDAARGALALGDDITGLNSPLTQWSGVEITDYSNNRYPKLNGRALKLKDYEQARSYAIAPDGQSFVLGADWYLRLFDRQGNARWTVPNPGAAWGVNITGDGRLVVAAFSDGTVRWFRASDGREMLAFFPHADRRRWVLWTPSGYYDAAPGAEDLIGWHLNRGRDNAADFYPASRFRSQFYRPDVIARLLQTGDEGEALRLANEDAGRKTEAAPVQVQKVLPPVVELLSPTEGAAVSSPNVTLRYSVRTPNDAPVTALRVRVNGQAVNLPETRNLAVAAAAAAAAREISVPIPSRDSDIMLFAENKNGVSTPASVRVLWKGGAPAGAAKDEFTVKPKLYVLAVGVSQYNNPDYRLGFAAKDAKDFTEALKKQKGALYREVEVKLLTDAGATRDEVVDGLDWLQKQVTAKDVGMLFLAGHGVNDPNGIYYYLPANADVDKLKRTGVPFSDIKNTLGSLAGKALFFVDTCHSGNVMGGRRAVSNDVTGIVNELASAENGVVVFSSSTGRQFSLEDPKWGNGAFTKALVEGLNGKADFNKTGRITHKMLDFYVAERVKQLTDGKQTPVNTSPAGVPDFPIVVVR